MQPTVFCYDDMLGGNNDEKERSIPYKFFDGRVLVHLFLQPHFRFRRNVCGWTGGCEFC